MKMIKKTVCIALVSLVNMNTSFADGKFCGNIVDKCAAREKPQQCKCYTDMHQYLSDKIASDSLDKGNGEGERIDKLHEFYAEKKQAACPG